LFEDPDNDKEIDFLSKFLKYCNYICRLFQELKDVAGKTVNITYIHLSNWKNEGEQFLSKSKDLKSAIIIIMPTRFT